MENHLRPISWEYRLVRTVSFRGSPWSQLIHYCPRIFWKLVSLFIVRSEDVFGRFPQSFTYPPRRCDEGLHCISSMHFIDTDNDIMCGLWVCFVGGSYFLAWPFRVRSVPDSGKLWRQSRQLSRIICSLRGMEFWYVQDYSRHAAPFCTHRFTCRLCVACWG